MDKEFASVIFWIVLGALAGGAYVAVSIAWNSFLLHVRAACPGEKTLVLLMHVFFRPPVYLAILGMYGFYGVLTGGLSWWFLAGFALPVVPVLREMGRK